ncbi:MAG: hypothetical protein P4L40_13785 [Terracidiphilus sp.]|nr:hypothetical protein [Terracidiphilus sp.]
MCTSSLPSQVHDLASAFGFYPGFRGVQLMTKLIDLITPGASVGVSVAGGGDYNQIVQVLDMTKIALEELV